jgi:hypothetical protein
MSAVETLTGNWIPYSKGVKTKRMSDWRRIRPSKPETEYKAVKGAMDITRVVSPCRRLLVDYRSLLFPGIYSGRDGARFWA